jgi:hypothetical protein
MPPSGPASTGWVRSERHDVDLSMLRLGIQCGGSWCTDGYVEAAWSDIHVELSDRSAPAVTAGRLDGWTSRPRTVAYSASDNSGIRRTRVYLDGALHSADTRSCDYSYRVPCSDASGSFTADPGELADGTHTFEVRALDATDSNTGSSGVTSFLVDSHGPTVEAGGQGSPGSWQPGPVTVTLSARDGASGMGAADDGQPLESGGYITYSLDGGTPRTASGDHAGVEVAGDGTHTLTFSAHDVAGNVSAEHTVTIRVGTPAERLAGPGAGFSAHASNAASTFSAARSFAGACPAEATLTPLRDTYVDQSRPDAANGGAAALTVRSAQGANARALLAFALPAADGCEVASARLRVYATSASDGRTITALRLASAWDDAAAWLTRPGAAGPGATVPSGAGWIAFDVTDQLRDVYRYGDSGLMLRDLTEGGAAAAAQQYASSEDGQGRRPELTVSFQ